MSYATYTDMINRYPNRDLVQLTNDDTAPNATTPNTAKLTQMLADASSEIDGYLESRFQLPLTDPPAVLNQYACIIAMYRLQHNSPLSDTEKSSARKNYEDAIATLKLVAKGQITLGLSGDGQEPGKSPAAISIQGPRPLFSREKLKVF